MHKIILFLYEIEFYMKNAFFWCIICWCRSKIANFWNFAHFLAIFSIFSIFAFFLWFVEKNSEKGSNQLEMIQNYVETWFLTFLWLQSREKWGGPQGPPPAPGKASRTSPLLGLTLNKPWGGGIKTQLIWQLPLARWTKFELNPPYEFFFFHI